MGSNASKVPSRKLDARDHDTTTSQLSDVHTHRSLSPRSLNELDSTCASYTVRSSTGMVTVGRERAGTAPAGAEGSFTGSRVHSLDDVRGVAFRANSLPSQGMIRERARSASYCALAPSECGHNINYSEPLTLNKVDKLEDDYVDICKYLSEQDDNPGLQMRYRRRSRTGSRTSVGSGALTANNASVSANDRNIPSGEHVLADNENGNGEGDIDGEHLVFDLDGHQRHIEDRIPATLDEESGSVKTDGEKVAVCLLNQIGVKEGVTVEKEERNGKADPTYVRENVEGKATQPAQPFNPFKQKQERRRHQRSKSDTLNINVSENNNVNSENKQGNTNRPVFQLGADHDDDTLNVDDFEAKQRELWLLRRARRVTIHEVSEELEGSPRKVAGPVAEIAGMAPKAPMVQANMHIGNRRRVTVSVLPSQPIRISTTSRFV